MSTSFSSLSIRNPTPSIILFIVLTIAGLIAFLKLPINNMPNIIVPILSIQINQPGAAPTEIETQITYKVEGILVGISGVKHINTTISEGSSLSIIEFQLGTDLDRAINEVRNALSSIKGQLADSVQEPIIQRMDMDNNAILAYTVEASEMRQEDLSWFIDDTLSRELLNIKGVAKIERTGGIEHEITLYLDPNRLVAFGISAADISKQLSQINANLPGGKVTLGDKEYLLRTLGSAKNIESLKETSIALSNNRNVKLKELGNLIDGGAEVRSISRLDGKPVVTFNVYRNKGSSEIIIASKIAAKLAQIGAKQPNVSFKQIFSLVKLTEISFQTAMYSFFESVFLTILVIFWFLRDKRATLIAALTIPLSIIPTFLVLHWLGFTLNCVSLLGISLVTGILVDDAIVEIENIYRHMKQGKTPYEAAIIASDEIGLAVIATTLAICSVFIPVSFLNSIPGQFFKQFGLTVSIAAFFSLLVARLLTPMLSAYLLKNEVTKKEEQSLWLNKYKNIIQWTLNNRRKTLIVILISMVLSFSIIPFIPKGLMPYEDYSESNLVIELPQGSTLEQTDITAQRIAIILKHHKEVEYVLTSINNKVNCAYIKIKLVEPNKRKLDQRQLEKKILEELKVIPDVRIRFSNLTGLKDVSVTLTSNDDESLNKAAKLVEQEMHSIEGVNGIENNASQKQPEILIIPDSVKVAQFGISVQNISTALKIATMGDSENNLAKFNYGNRQIPIRVHISKNDIKSINLIENMRIPSSRGIGIPLSAIATIKYSLSSPIIEHYDRKRKITIGANLNGIALGDAIVKIYTLPSMVNLPKGVEIQTTGDFEEMKELFMDFIQSVILGLLMVYAIQVILYKNWIQPLSRMTALPLSIGGAFFMLLLTNTELNMPVLIGLLMLMGIADKNSILLVDYMIELINRGIPRSEAIVEACITRARPIIMTTFAMLAGMIPIALGVGGTFRQPMAIAVIGGLISSTILSLILVPVMFSYIHDFEKWIIPKLKKLLN